MLDLIVTVTSGVLVYLLGLIINEIWLYPLQQYKKLKQTISYNLTYYANFYSNVIDAADNDIAMIEAYNNASDVIRKSAAELEGFVYTLSWFKPMIPSEAKLQEASSCLIGLSNGFFCAYNTHNIFYRIDSNMKNVEDIKKYLKLEKHQGRSIKFSFKRKKLQSAKE